MTGTELTETEREYEQLSLNDLLEVMIRLCQEIDQKMEYYKIANEEFKERYKAGRI